MERQIAGLQALHSPITSADERSETLLQLMPQAEIRVVDSFAGGLSQDVRETCALLNQVITEIEAKMTAAVQVTDTDEAFRLKSTQRRLERPLRKELMKLAGLEGTRPVFKCATHEVLKLRAASCKENNVVVRQ